MLKHIVFFELADNAEGKSKTENAEIIKMQLENLKNLIPEIKMIEVGINYPNAPKTNYDIALYSVFENLDALNVYQEHPEHKKIAAFIGKVRTARAAVDYEV
jgi:hypothetical protein